MYVCKSKLNVLEEVRLTNHNDSCVGIELADSLNYSLIVVSIVSKRIHKRLNYILYVLNERNWNLYFNVAFFYVNLALTLVVHKIDIYVVWDINSINRKGILKEPNVFRSGISQRLLKKCHRILYLYSGGGHLNVNALEEFIDIFNIGFTLELRPVILVSSCSGELREKFK